MKRLLLSACLVGVVFAGHTHSPPQGQFVSEPLNVAVAAPPVSGGVSSRAKSQYPGLQQVALRSPAVGAVQADGTPVASIDDLFAPALPQAAKPEEDAKASDARLVDESAMWVVVTRGAWMHSGPSVATPVVGHQSPGKEMHLIELFARLVPGLRPGNWEARLGLRQILSRADRPPRAEACSRGARATSPNQRGARGLGGATEGRAEGAPAATVPCSSAAGSAESRVSYASPRGRGRPARSRLPALGGLRLFFL